MSLTKNRCRHEVDAAAWESEQSRFTISIGVVISINPPLTEFRWRQAWFPTAEMEVSVSVGWRGVINHSLHLACSRLNQGLLAVVASVGNVIMAPLDPPPHNAHLVRHTMQGEAGLNPAS